MGSAQHRATRSAVLLGEAAHQGSPLRIKGGERFVQQPQRRGANQRPRQRRPPLLTL